MGRVILGTLAAMLLAAPPAQALKVARAGVHSPPAAVECAGTVVADVSLVETVRGDEARCATPLGVCHDDYTDRFERPGVPTYDSDRGCRLAAAGATVDCREQVHSVLLGTGWSHRHCGLARGDLVIACIEDSTLGHDGFRSRTCTVSDGSTFRMSCTDEEATTWHGPAGSAGECTVPTPDGSSRTYCTHPVFVPTLVTGSSIPVPTRFEDPPPEGCLG